MVWRLTLMPASREASTLPPMATVRRPKVVRLSRNQPQATTRAKIQISTGMPSRLPENAALNPLTLTIWVVRLASNSASPRAPTSMAIVAMNATTPP